MNQPCGWHRLESHSSLLGLPFQTPLFSANGLKTGLPVTFSSLLLLEESLRSSSNLKGEGEHRAGGGGYELGVGTRGQEYRPRDAQATCLQL